MATQLEDDKLGLLQIQDEHFSCHEYDSKDLPPRFESCTQRSASDSRKHHQACCGSAQPEVGHKNRQVNGCVAKSSHQFREKGKCQNGFLRLVVFLAFQLVQTVPKSYLQGVHRGFANAQTVPIGYFTHNPLEAPRAPILYPPPPPPQASPQSVTSEQAMTSNYGHESLLAPDLDWAKRVWPVGLVQPVSKSNLNYAHQPPLTPSSEMAKIDALERRQQVSQNSLNLSTPKGLHSFLIGSNGRARVGLQRSSLEDQYALSASASIDPSPSQWPQAYENLQVNTLMSKPANNSFLLQLVAPTSIRRNSSEGFVMNLSAPYESPRKHVSTVSAADLRLRLINLQQNSSLRPPIEPPTDGSANPIAIASFESGGVDSVSSEEPSSVPDSTPESDNNDQNQMTARENQQWDSQQLRPESGQSDADESDNINGEYTDNQQGEQQVDGTGDQTVDAQSQQPSGVGEDENPNLDTALVTNVDMGNRSTESLMIQAASVDPASESYLAAQLPSQYDSVIRVPPDGHYDDYFKPDASSLKDNSLSSLYGSLPAGTTGFSTQSSTSFNNRTNDFDVDDFTSGPHNRAKLNGTRIANNVNLIPSQGYPKNEDEENQYNGQDQLRNSFYHTANHQHQVSSSINPVRFDTAAPQQEQPKKSSPTNFDSDYTRQYYVNQGPLRQQEAQNDNSVEFLVTNSTYSDHERPINQTTRQTKHNSDPYNTETKPYYSRDPMYAPHTTRAPTMISASNSNSTLAAIGDRNNTFELNLWKHKVRSRDAQTGNPVESDDSIRLILANTNSSWRDPSNNEKMISYTTSEGRDFAQPGGAMTGPRHTFINKDLNELPPGENVNANQTRNEDSYLREAPRQSSTMSPIENEGNLELPRLREDRREPQFETEKRFQAAERGKPSEDNRNSTQPYDEEDGSRENDGPSDKSNSVDRSMDRGRRPGSARAMQYDQVTPRPSLKKSSSEEKKDQPTNQRKRRIPVADGSNMRSNPSMRAAQVTEAHFDPTRDLILNHPTQAPSVPESTISTITELPAKVKRLRENQADKNELMNELLTALDRVKSAIYKLQPLTAKMNAIYRKSVTSNTRDIIMDHHKGTYAKRYPPGDYDDTYDRMHPSELIERQRSSSARKGRRAVTNDSNRNSANRRPSSGRYSSNRDDERVAASTTNSVYVPAPKKISDKFKVNSSESHKTSLDEKLQSFELRSGTLMNESDEDDETYKLIFGRTKLVATGTGRRGRNGHGPVSLSSSLNGKILYDDDAGVDDEDDSQKSKIDRYVIEDSGVLPASRLRRNSSNQATDFNETKSAEDDAQSPLFGYRITIYQTPEDELEGLASNLTDLDEFDRLPTDGLLSYRVDDVPQETGPENHDDSETMSTSESSIAATTQSDYLVDSIRAPSALIDAQDHLDRSESHRTKSSHHNQSGKSAKKDAKESKKQNKSEKEESDNESTGGRDRKKSTEKGDKKASKSTESHSRGKHLAEDKKKKKEFKKIKHNKGITSKESHKMHRDKQVKAHDRGAAKEKALKERTQIEFFEREQIVDDEFEKGKKSMIKANWVSGHDAKKSSSKDTGGDGMASGGSHLVKHYEPMDDAMAASSLVGIAAHGQSKSIETSSGRESNKFEKKAADAKGKKFKGWREKGYKIITETEFIDRGSLHDSAYKKRDKGAAHHQKLKKHESSSEGHHGSVEERLKKMARKEEKESTFEEKKREMMDKGKAGEKERKDVLKAKKMSKKEMEEAKKKKSTQHSKHRKDDDDDHEQEESVGIGSIMRKPDDEATTKVPISTTTQPPKTTVASPAENKTSTVAPKPDQTTDPIDGKRLHRLMNADGHDRTGTELTRQINWAHQRGKKDKAEAKQASGTVELVINNEVAKKPQNTSTTEQPDPMTTSPAPSTKMDLSNKILSVDGRGIPENVQPIATAPILPKTDSERPKNRSLTLFALKKGQDVSKELYNFSDTNALKDAEKINLLAELIQATVAEQNALREGRHNRLPAPERAVMSRKPQPQLEVQAPRLHLQINHKLEQPKINHIEERERQQLVPPFIDHNDNINSFGVTSNHMNGMQNFYTQPHNNNERRILPSLGFGVNQQQLFPSFPILQPQAYMDTQAPVGRTWQIL